MQQYTQNPIELYLKNIITLTIEYHNTLIEVMMLHGRSRIQNSQRTFSFRLKSIIRPPVVQIMAQTGHQQPQYLKFRHKPEITTPSIVTFLDNVSNIIVPIHLSGFQHGEHSLSYIQGVSPIVIFHRSIVLFNTQNPATQNL